MFRFDSSRTWQGTRDYKGTFSPDMNGRPVQINVWYPAAAAGSTRQMRFGDYVDQSSAEIFSKFNAVMKERNQRNAVDSVPSDQFGALQATPMNAYADAPAAEGRFPTVLYFGGLDAEINSNVILAEYLASQGYIVASVSLLGPTDEQTFQSRTPGDLEATVRDMEFAWSILFEEPNTDKAKLAAMGHSVGAIEAVLLGDAQRKCLRRHRLGRNLRLSRFIDGAYPFLWLRTRKDAGCISRSEESARGARRRTAGSHSRRFFFDTPTEPLSRSGTCTTAISHRSPWSVEHFTRRLPPSIR